MKTRMFAVLAGLMLAPAIAARADVIHVPTDVASIQDAVNMAEDGDEVVVAPGVYTLTSTLEIFGPITVRSSGGPGVTTLQIEQDAFAVMLFGNEEDQQLFQGFTVRPAPSKSPQRQSGVVCEGWPSTVRDCVMTGFDDSGVVCIDGSRTVFEFCTITGNGDGEFDDGGVRTEALASPVFFACTITHNSGQHGGGLNIGAGTVDMYLCDISHNQAGAAGGSGGAGGGIQVLSLGTLTLYECTLEGNELLASANPLQGGGAIALESGAQLTAYNTDFIDNSAGQGGAIAATTFCTIELDGCVFRNNIAGSNGSANGGALNLLNNTTLIATDTLFDSNSFESLSGTEYRGGAIYANDCRMLIDRCTFLNNGDDSFTSGGAIFVVSNIFINELTEYVTVVDSHFEDNTALFGGAIALEDIREPLQIALRGSTFLNNRALSDVQRGSPGRGGALAGSFDAHDCVFIANRAVEGAVLSDLFYTDHSRFLRCVFDGNSASDGSGVMDFDTGSSVETILCVFSRNSSANFHPAVVSADNSFSVPDFSATDCVFVGNIGNGIANGTVELRGCTVAGNATSQFRGGALFEEGTFVNCIAAANDDVPLVFMNGETSVRHSLLEGADAPPTDGNLNVAPRFVRRPSPGFDEVWGTLDDDLGDLRLKAGSPVIDAGDSTERLPWPATDLDGNPRFVDDAGIPDTGVPGFGGAPIVDMGAYEFQGISPMPCPGDVTTTGSDNGGTFFGVPDGEVNLSDLQFSLSAWQQQWQVADVNTTGTNNGQPDGEINLSDLQYSLTVWQGGLSACP